MAPHPIHLPARANDNPRGATRPRDSSAIRAAILQTQALCAGGGWLVEDTGPRAPVLDMTLAAAGARLAASWR